MTDHQTLSVEATKLVKDWSIWMVTVQTALIGFLITATELGMGNASFELAVQIALGCFAVSVLAAAWVLSALPYIVIRLPEYEDPNIYLMRLSSAPLLKDIPLWLMSAVQHWAFAIGMTSLIAGRILCW